MKASLILGGAIAVAAGSYALAAPIDVMVFKDTFETHTVGQNINTLTPEVGSIWRQYAGSTAQAAITDAQGNPGNSLLLRREQASGLDSGQVDVYARGGTAAGKTTAANTTFTVISDYWATEDLDGMTWIWSPGVSNNVGPQFSCLNGTWRYYKPGVGFVNSNVMNGSGTWNQLELEVMYGADNGSGKAPMSFNFYLTRGAGGTQPAMSRTLILSDNHPTLSNLGAEVAVNFEAATGADTLYVDNVQIGYQVPEPASLGLVGLGAAALIRRRRA